MTRIVKFSECVEYMIKGPFGSDMKKSLYVPKGDNTYKVYIQGNAIQQDEALGDYYVSEEYFHDKLERFEVHPGDYIITCDGTLGKFIKLSDGIERGVISSSLLLLKLNEEIINDKYFELLWEHTMLATLASQARNACLVHLPSAKAIGDLEVKLPEMSEQLAIAEKAFSVKRNIAYREKQQELLDELIKARFVEMFGDPIINPRGWRKSKFGDVVYYQEGPGVRNWQFRDSGIKLINIRNIVDDTLDLSNTNNYLEVDEVNKKYAHFLLNEGDYVMASSGVTWGKIAEVNSEHLPLCLNTSMIRLRPIDDSVICKSYIYHFIKSDGFRKQIERLITGSAQPNFGPSHLAKVDILVPDIVIQKEFSDFVKQVDKSKSVVRKSLDEAQLLFDSLMQEYFG